MEFISFTFLPISKKAIKIVRCDVNKNTMIHEEPPRN